MNPGKTGPIRAANADSLLLVCLIRSTVRHEVGADLGVRSDFGALDGGRGPERARDFRLDIAHGVVPRFMFEFPSPSECVHRCWRIL